MRCPQRLQLPEESIGLSCFSPAGPSDKTSPWKGTLLPSFLPEQAPSSLLVEIILCIPDSPFPFIITGDPD